MNHPYQNLVSRVAFCVERNGLKEVLMIPLRMVASPIVIPFLPKGTFPFAGRSLPYFHHRYNVAWANERTIEIPIARYYLEAAAGRRILEVGNVMSHYQSVTHTILDKFESGPGVVNEDILTWNPRHKFDLILSISTFEHIGYDDEEKDSTGERILGAIRRCQGFLNPGGRLVLTAAAGYNPAFDQLVAGNRFGATRLHLFHRVSHGRWAPCDEARYLKTRYRHPYSFGNAVVVAEFGPI